jgi:hypothetical protein
MLFRYRPRNREVLVYMKFPYKSGATNQNKWIFYENMHKQK